MPIDNKSVLFVGTELAILVLDGKQFISHRHVVFLLQIHFYWR